MSVIEQIVIIWLLYVHGVKLYWDNDFFSVEPQDFMKICKMIAN